MNIELQRNKSEMASHEKNLKKLRKEILFIQNSVSGQTNKFSKIISIKTNLKNEIEGQKNKLEDEKKRLDKDILMLRKIFAGLVLIEETDDEIDYKYLTLNKLREKEGKLKATKASISEKLVLINRLQTELGEYDFIETDLIQNIEEMHSREKALNGRIKKISVALKNNRNNLNVLISQKKDLEKKLREDRLKKRKEANIKKKESRVIKNRMLEDGRNEVQGKGLGDVVSNLNFNLPLRKFDRIKKDKSGGISLFVNSDRKIISPEEGEVMYSGKLSSYGNVIVIRHADNYQSVILGDIISGVEKKQKVKKGDVVGKVIENSGDLKKVYYELRNKNKKVSYDKIFRGLKI